MSTYRRVPTWIRYQSRRPQELRHAILALAQHTVMNCSTTVSEKALPLSQARICLMVGGQSRSRFEVKVCLNFKSGKQVGRSGEWNGETGGAIILNPSTAGGLGLGHVWRKRKRKSKRGKEGVSHFVLPRSLGVSEGRDSWIVEASAAWREFEVFGWDETRGEIWMTSYGI